MSAQGDAEALRLGKSGARRIADHNGEAARVVRDRQPGVSPLTAFHRHFRDGLDGRDLTELGLKSGNLTVDDQRNGKKWTFQDINLSITRPSAGGVALTLSSEAIALPWLVRAAMTPAANGHRIVDI
jgi:hypothetical protein